MTVHPPVMSDATSPVHKWRNSCESLASRIKRAAAECAHAMRGWSNQLVGLGRLNWQRGGSQSLTHQRLDREASREQARAEMADRFHAIQQ
jgi:hypothetical protein